MLLRLWTSFGLLLVAEFPVAAAEPEPLRCIHRHERVAVETLKVAVCLHSPENFSSLTVVGQVTVVVENVSSRAIELRIDVGALEFFGVAVTGDRIDSRSPRRRGIAAPPEPILNVLQPGQSYARTAPVSEFLLGEPAPGRQYIVGVDPDVRFRPAGTSQSFTDSMLAIMRDRGYRRAVFDDVVLK